MLITTLARRLRNGQRTFGVRLTEGDFEQPPPPWDAGFPLGWHSDATRRIFRVGGERYTLTAWCGAQSEHPRDHYPPACLYHVRQEDKYLLGMWHYTYARAQDEFKQTVQLPWLGAYADAHRARNDWWLEHGWHLGAGKRGLGQVYQELRTLAHPLWVRAEPGGGVFYLYFQASEWARNRELAAALSRWAQTSPTGCFVLENPPLRSA